MYGIFELKLLIFFLPINFNICFGCSKEPSHRGGIGSFEYAKHMFWLKNKKNNFWYALLTKGLDMDIVVNLIRALCTELSIPSSKTV